MGSWRPEGSQLGSEEDDHLCIESCDTNDAPDDTLSFSELNAAARSLSRVDGHDRLLLPLSQSSARQPSCQLSSEL